MQTKPRFSPTICLTHDCNLHCSYCYQEHDKNSVMSFSVAKQCVDWIFNNVPSGMQGVEISLIGGEPLLEFELIKKIITYTLETYPQEDFVFSAATNGTLLTQTMKEWLVQHRDIFKLGLSLDGCPETHNINRCDSYDRIDIDFFVKNYPDEGVKMTLSQHSLEHLAANIEHIHSLGFKYIGGVNLFEGTFDWSDEKYIRTLIPQLEELVEYYVKNDTIPVNQMLNRMLASCEQRDEKCQKWCGIGTGAIFFDTDGKQYPCPFVTPMTFSKSELEQAMSVDFSCEENFVDMDCFNDCYIFPVCPHCSGSNYLVNKSFNHWDKSKCRIQKLITLYSAELQAKRILKNPKCYSDSDKYYIITAIEKIRECCLDEFSSYY